MLKKVMITAALGAAIVGGGTAALASSGSHLASPSSSSTSASTTTKSGTGNSGTAQSKHAQKWRNRRVQLGRALHGTWVTKAGKKGTFITHDGIHGTVSRVTATSITVKAVDGYTERFAVTSSTKVRMRVAGQAKGNVSSIAKVKSGDKVIVLGTGNGTPTATRVVAGLKR